MVRWWGSAAVVVAMLGGCASIVSTNRSTVQIATSPANAECSVKGHGFSARVITPASLTLPSSAAPLIVTCVADGWRPTSYSLDATADGWIWGNSALVVVTGGAAVLGLLVDESRDAGKVYREAVTYELDRDRPRTVFTSDRVNGVDATLQTR